MGKRVNPPDFWLQVDKRGDGDCWVWTGKRWPHAGYGKSYGRSQYAHRVAFALVNGPIPDGKHVMHTCDNRLCCNPNHLKLGTHMDNMADRTAKGRTARHYGETNHVAKLSDIDCDTIQQRFDAGETVAAIHRSYSSVTYQNVWQIAKRKGRANGSRLVAPFIT